MQNSLPDSNAKRTVLFAGGGTGGHLFPGLAVADALSHKEPAWRMLFVGSDRKVETDILDKTPYDHHALAVESSSILRRHPLRFARSFWSAYRQCCLVMNETQPACVVGLGGYASLPVLYAARKLRVPIVLLEQNRVLGRANRWFCRSATKLCLSFAQTIGVPETVINNVQVTGNPVRDSIAKLMESSDHQDDDAQKTMLILGGSQGSVDLNRLIMEALLQIPADRQTAWKIVHQTGDEMGEVLKYYEQQRWTFEVAPFFSEMSLRYQQADLVIARAGATTLAEVACAGCPALLIPYPNSVGDHQLKNARYFEDAGAAYVVEQQQNMIETVDQLQEIIKIMMHSESQRSQMRNKMQALAQLNAATNVATIIRNIVAERL